MIKFRASIKISVDDVSGWGTVTGTELYQGRVDEIDVFKISSHLPQGRSVPIIYNTLEVFINGVWVKHMEEAK